MIIFLTVLDDVYILVVFSIALSSGFAVFGEKDLRVANGFAGTTSRVRKSSCSSFRRLSYAVAEQDVVCRAQFIIRRWSSSN